jgi:hypothetical protein
VQIDTEPRDVGLQGSDSAVAKHAANRHAGLAARGEEHRSGRISGKLLGFSWKRPVIWTATAPLTLPRRRAAVGNVNAIEAATARKEAKRD